MTKLPDCPKCQEDELWFARYHGLYKVSCYLCGWNAYGDIGTKEDGQELEDAIAEAVAAARAPGGESGGEGK